MLLGNRDYNRKKALEAASEAKAWIKRQLDIIYANVTDDELDEAARWIAYAEPHSFRRSCISPEMNAAPWIDDATVAVIPDKLAVILSDDFVWLPDHRKKYVALHAFHSTGIEGNILSLPETELVVDGKPLFAGFSGDRVSTPLLTSSVTEVRNFHLIFDDLGLSRVNAAGIWKPMSIQGLVDINSAIIQDMNTATGLRQHSVSIGHQHVILPQKDEIPRLMESYVAWLNAAVTDLVESKELASDLLLVRIISLACDELLTPSLCTSILFQTATGGWLVSSVGLFCKSLASLLPYSKRKCVTSTFAASALQPSTPTTKASASCTSRLCIGLSMS